MPGTKSDAALIDDAWLMQRYPLTGAKILEALDLDREARKEAARGGRRYRPACERVIAELEAKLGQSLR